MFHGRASLEERKASFVKFEKHLHCGRTKQEEERADTIFVWQNGLSREIVFSQKFRDQLLNTFLKRFSFQRGQLTFTISFINRNLISNILLLSNRETAPSGTAVSLCFLGLMKLQGWTLRCCKDLCTDVILTQGPPVTDLIHRVSNLSRVTETEEC